jgi:hypothetical protein
MDDTANTTYSLLNPFLFSMSSLDLKGSSSREEGSTHTSDEDGGTRLPTLKNPTSSFEDGTVINSLCPCVLDTSEANFAVRDPATDTQEHDSATISSNNKTQVPPDHTPSFRIKTAFAAVIALSTISPPPMPLSIGGTSQLLDRRLPEELYY